MGFHEDGNVGVVRDAVTVDGRHGRRSVSRRTAGFRTPQEQKQEPSGQRRLLISEKKRCEQGGVVEAIYFVIERQQKMRGTQFSQTFQKRVRSAHFCPTRRLRKSYSEVGTPPWD